MLDRCWNVPDAPRALAMAVTCPLFCASSRGLPSSSPTIQSSAASLNRNAHSRERFILEPGFGAEWFQSFRSTVSQESKSSWPPVQYSAESLNRNANSRARYGLATESLAVSSSSFCLQSSISRTVGRCRRERTLLLPRNNDGRGTGGAGRSMELWTLVPKAVVKEEQQEPASVQTSSMLKEFLEDLKAVGRVRLIVNTGVAVLESVTSLEKLFYHVSSRGEYANVMSRDDNVDFHLLLRNVALARFVKGKSARGDIPTYMIRFVDVNDSVAISILVMWKLGTDGEYDPGQVEAFEVLVKKYGEEVKFPSE